jgi:hypothetical protein
MKGPDTQRQSDSQDGDTDERQRVYAHFLCSRIQG